MIFPATYYLFPFRSNYSAQNCLPTDFSKIGYEHHATGVIFTFLYIVHRRRTFSAVLSLMIFEPRIISYKAKGRWQFQHDAVLDNLVSLYLGESGTYVHGKARPVCKASWGRLKKRAAEDCIYSSDHLQREPDELDPLPKFVRENTLPSL